MAFTYRFFSKKLFKLIALTVMLTLAVVPAYAQQTITISHFEPSGNGHIISNAQFKIKSNIRFSGIAANTLGIWAEYIEGSGSVSGYKYNGKVYTYIPEWEGKFNYNELLMNVGSIKVEATVIREGTKLGSFSDKLVYSGVSGGEWGHLMWEKAGFSQKIDPKSLTVTSFGISSTASSNLDRMLGNYIEEQKRKEEEAEKKAEEERKRKEENKKENVWMDIQNEEEKSTTGNIWDSIDKTQNDETDSKGGNLWGNLNATGKGKTWGGVGNVIEFEITSKDGKQGVTDQNGNVLIPFKEWNVLGYKNGIAKVQFDSEYKETDHCRGSYNGWDFHRYIMISTNSIGYVQSDGSFLMKPEKKARISIAIGDQMVIYLTTIDDTRSDEEHDRIQQRIRANRNKAAKRKCGYLAAKVKNLEERYQNQGFTVNE